MSKLRTHAFHGILSLPSVPLHSIAILMQFALVNSERREPTRGSRASCSHCGADMIAKCGPRVMHHWAHASRRNCDPWWKNETQWHRDWKNNFPEHCREVTHQAHDGEIHRADIKTPTGIFIEVQHSSMSDSERESRENFYGNLVWILDGRSFRNSFHVGCKLPEPDAPVVRDVVWHQLSRQAYRCSTNPLADTVPPFSRVSEIAKDYPGFTKQMWGSGPSRMVLLHRGDEIADIISTHYRGHHQFYWTRPRKTWLDAMCPVYIDFGGELLHKLQQYDESGMLCVRLVAKRKLIHDVMVEINVHKIATRFYPIA